MKNIFKSLLTAIGAFSSFITIAWAIFPSLTSYASNYSIRFLLAILFLAIAYALYTNRKKNKIVLKLSERITATVFSGDIFELEGILVIPVNEYFDIDVDEKIVSSETLHGKFICKYFAKSGDTLPILFGHQ